MMHASAACGCCEGTQVVIPQPTANRPGLSTLAYRVGTHATFLETMQARLSSHEYLQLAGLKMRDLDDLTMALLDGWATVADVLTFYQERIANEGYLRTATERRSILALAQLVGYALRPGVSASVYLAYTLDDNSGPVEVPAGARAQSIPNPGELPQSFETSEPLKARAEWNNLKPRMAQPQFIEPRMTDGVATINKDTIYFDGTATNLKANDPLLFVFDGGKEKILRYVKTVEAQFGDTRTKVMLQEKPPPKDPPTNGTTGPSERITVASTTPLEALQSLTKPLLLPPSLQPANRLRLSRSTSQAFDGDRDTLPQLLTAFKPRLAETAYRAWANASVPQTVTVEVYALRVKAAPFGHNARPRPMHDATGRIEDYEEWPIAGSITYGVVFSNERQGALRRAAVSLKHGAKTDGTTIQLTNERIPDISLTTGKIQISAVTNNPPVDSGPTIIGYTFTFFINGAISRTFTIDLPHSTGVKVQIDKEDPRTVSKGQVLHYDIGDRTIAIALRGVGDDSLLTVTDELPLVPQLLKVVLLDAQYNQIVPQSWVVFSRADNPTSPTICQVKETHTISPSDYGMTGTVTQLTVKENWLPDTKPDFSAVRKTTVYAQSELLPLAAEPITDPGPGDLQVIRGKTIPLGRVYNGLQSGRWVIVSGERTDIPGTTGVRGSELVMLKGVQQSFNHKLPGDAVHTTLLLANEGLQYTYKCDSVTIYGNVVKATHGETRNEVLGSGDASKALASFTLKQPPLTYVSAPNPAGVNSTLHVRVNTVEWHETDTLAALGPNDRHFITRTDDDAKTTVVFGNGTHGARLPTGVENITSVYRNGIGKGGNVKAEQVSLLATRPLGVKGVINPLRAAGGADKESRDQARRNTPLAVMALDRLVSTDDYAAFARTFGGIGKASAARLSDGHRPLVYVTIAGADDIPIDETSDLYHNLCRALRDYGDPYLPIKVAVRELLALIISANVRVLPDYQWESVARDIRTALLDTFSFERRELGQSIFLSEIINVMQQVMGVAYVDVDVLQSLSETEITDATLLKEKLKKLETPAKPEDYIRAGLARVNAHYDPQASLPTSRLLPAQLAYLLPDVPDTLILNEVTS
jgi:predicted phage baseplate assembly protein